jgi:hypothetical protein
MMTEKENFLRCVNGQEPAWVPRYGLFPSKYAKPAVCMAHVDLFNRKVNPDGTFVDMFGVEYTPTDSTGGARCPPGQVHPAGHHQVARGDPCPEPGGDRLGGRREARRQGHRPGEHGGLPGHPCGLFSDADELQGLLRGSGAMAEEPEECYALLSYLANFYDEVAKNLIRYLKPDVFSITDDTATVRNPFMSLACTAS